MKNWPITLSLGSRSSRLAKKQCQIATAAINALMPDVNFSVCLFQSPGDRQKSVDLKQAPADFFTRDLDQALLNHQIDAALHSAKDCAYPFAAGIDWFWLPAREERGDALVLRPGESLDDLPPRPVIGSSSQRREQYCVKRFPDAQIKPARGNIEERLAQLDNGGFDLLLMAVAALKRLGLTERISRTIPLDELETPEAQGALCLSFRAHDERWRIIRSLLVKPTAFVGAGPGRAGLCSTEGVEKLKKAQVCFHDALIDPRLLDYLPADCLVRYVGKRKGNHSLSQNEISRLIGEHARKGYAVVRLKGGDPNIFGRLEEEIRPLEQDRLPFTITPSVSSAQVAAGEAGLLLTRRNKAAGFTIIAAGQKGGGCRDLSLKERGLLPLVIYMGLACLETIVGQLIQEQGQSPKTPVSVILDSGGRQPQTIRGSLADIVEKFRRIDRRGRPGLIVVGPGEDSFFNKNLPLLGRKILITGSPAIQDEAQKATIELGGLPVAFPLIEQQPAPGLEDLGAVLANSDWLVLTSPGAGRCLLETLQRQKTDLRCLPKIAVSGPRSARIFTDVGVFPEIIADPPFGAASLLEKTSRLPVRAGRLVRLRSDMAGSYLAERLIEQGFDVEDRLLYRTVSRKKSQLPDFDAVFLASSSAARCFFDYYDKKAVAGKMCLAIGRPTAKVLRQAGVERILAPAEATCRAALLRLAGEIGQQRVKNSFVQK